MAILKRYRNSATFQDKNGNVFSARYKRLSKDTAYFTVKLTSPATFDLLSSQHYGTPVLFWIIADLNDYIDSTVTLPAGTEVKIPQI